MLLQFVVGNHGSVREPQTLSAVAHDAHPDLAVRDVPGPGKLRALPAVGVFGPNASGKSKLMDALAFMQMMVLSSHARFRPDDPIPRTPFLLDDHSRDLPSSFELDFACEGVRYHYGFECDDDRITREWLSMYVTHRRTFLFRRDATKVEYGTAVTGPRRVAERVMRPNSLYLSASAATNVEPLRQVYRWFERSLRMASDYDAAPRMRVSLHELNEHDGRQLLRLVQAADVGVSGMRERPSKPPSEALVNGLRQLSELLDQHRDEFKFTVEPMPDVLVAHETDSGERELSILAESTGTQTWLTMAGPVLQTLRSGSTLVVDELDARLHPDLTTMLVGLFQDPQRNRSGAQIIFNSHETALLSSRNPFRLRRDQVWFTERDEESATKVFPLIDFAVRKEGENVELSYLLGRYGAVPNVDEGALARLFLVPDEGGHAAA